MIDFHPTIYGLKMGYDVSNLGILATLMSPHDPRPLHEQMNANYAHGGGWDDFQGFTLGEEDTLHYPGDRPLRPLAGAIVRGQLVMFYEGEWLAIISDDRSFTVSRVD